MITLVMPLVRRVHLALQEFAPHMAVLMLPGGYLIALTGWFHGHWPRIARWSLAVQRIAGVAAKTVSAAR